MKHPEWQSRLQSLVSGKHKKPFAWGSFDCFTFTSECYEAVFGQPLLDVLGKYDTPKTAVVYYQKLKEQLNQKDIIAYLDNCFPRYSARIPKTADIIARREKDGGVFGYALGFGIDQRVAFVGVDGLTMSRLNEEDILWRPTC